ncbi:MAG: hypothetical protein Q9216_002802 [Gyalolechia sp. 2 TL-2023]
MGYEADNVGSKQYVEGNSKDRAGRPLIKPQAAASQKGGLLSVLPESWIPYAELMRLDRPAGFYAFYIPYLVGLGYAACIADTVPSRARLFSLSVLFFFVCILLRGVACAWNDNVDQEYDRKVARCRLRPIARGVITTRQAHVFTALLMLAGAPLFTLLPRECSYHAVGITILFGAYAFMKRVTNYPQVVLGFPFAWAILLSCAALEVDPLSEQWSGPTACLFVANVLWTIIYDTVYAHQDVKDDVKAGVNSMAVRFVDNTKVLATTLAICQAGLLLSAGWQARLSLVYFIISCGGSAAALGIMITRVNLREPASCAWFFYRGFWYVGGSMVIGLYGGYLTRWYDAKALHLSPAKGW